jgi:hypothetical protein
MSFGIRIREKDNPRWEPYAGKPHVRFCARGAMKITSLPLHRRAFMTLLGGPAAWPAELCGRTATQNCAPAPAKASNNRVRG